MVAGLKEFLKPIDIKGKHVVVVTNLKPAKLRSVESKGMLLAAEKGKKVRLVEAPKSKPGAQVYVEGITPKTAMINIDQFAKIKLKVKNKKAIYNNQPLKTDKEDIFVDIEDDAKVC